MKKMYRQGDVLLVRMDRPPQGKRMEVERENGRVILAHGEATGHAHAIGHPGAMLFNTGGDTLLSLKEDAVLSHEEHFPIELPAGLYQVVRQREYTHEGWIHVED